MPAIQVVITYVEQDMSVLYAKVVIIMENSGTNRTNTHLEIKCASVVVILAGISCFSL